MRSRGQVDPITIDSDTDSSEAASPSKSSTQQQEQQAPATILDHDEVVQIVNKPATTSPPIIIDLLCNDDDDDNDEKEQPHANEQKNATASEKVVMEESSLSSSSSSSSSCAASSILKQKTDSTNNNNNMMKKIKVEKIEIQGSSTKAVQPLESSSNQNFESTPSALDHCKSVSCESSSSSSSTPASDKLLGKKRQRPPELEEMVPPAIASNKKTNDTSNHTSPHDNDQKFIRLVQETLQDKRIGENDPWTKVYHCLLNSNLLQRDRENNCYVFATPSLEPQQGGTRGVHCVQGESGLQEWVRQHLDWKGPTATDTPREQEQSNISNSPTTNQSKSTTAMSSIQQQQQQQQQQPMKPKENRIVRKYTFSTKEQIGISLEAGIVVKVNEGTQAYRKGVPLNSRILSLNGYILVNGDNIKQQFEIIIQSCDQIELEFAVPSVSPQGYGMKASKSYRCKKKRGKNYIHHGLNLVTIPKNTKDHQGSSSSSDKGSSEDEIEEENSTAGALSVRAEITRSPRKHSNPNITAVSSASSRRRLDSSSLDRKTSPPSSLVSNSKIEPPKESSTNANNTDNTELLTKLTKPKTPDGSDEIKDVGSRVYACWPENNSYYWGTITQIHLPPKKAKQKRTKKTYTVVFDDGDQKDLPSHKVWSVASYRKIFDEDPPPRPKSSPNLTTNICSVSQKGLDVDEVDIGSRVYARWTNGTWYWGHIRNKFKREKEYRYSVQFDDGDLLEDVAPCDIATEDQCMQGITGKVFYCKKTKLYRASVKYGQVFHTIGAYATHDFATWIQKEIITVLASDGNSLAERRNILDKVAKKKVEQAKQTFLKTWNNDRKAWCNKAENANYFRLRIQFASRSWALGHAPTKKEGWRIINIAREMLAIEEKSLEKELDKMKENDAKMTIDKVKRSMKRFLEDEDDVEGGNALYQAKNSVSNKRGTTTNVDVGTDKSTLESLIRAQAIDMFAGGSYKSLASFVECFNRGRQRDDPRYITYNKFWTWWDTERYAQIENLKQFKKSSFTDPTNFVDFLNSDKEYGRDDFVSMKSFMHCLRTHQVDLGIQVKQSSGSDEVSKDLIRTRAIDAFVKGSQSTIRRFVDIFNVGKKGNDPEFVSYQTFWGWWDTERKRQQTFIERFEASTYNDPKAFVDFLNKGVGSGSQDFVSYASFMYCFKKHNEASNNLMKLFSSRCNTCVLCCKEDCTRCEPCARNKCRDKNKPKEVCLRKMCCKIKTRDKEQPAAGFPPGWRFIFDKPPKKRIFQNIGDHEKLAGLILISPHGRRYYSIETACNHHPANLRDVAGITKAFCKLVGEPIQRHDVHHVLIGKGICENWTDVSGSNKVVHGIITDCKIQEDDSEDLVYFIVTYNENSRSHANNFGSVVPKSRKIKASLAWGGYLMLHEKLKTPEKDLISPRPSLWKWITPEMRNETQVRIQNGTWLPQLTLALRNFHLVFTVKESTIPNAGMGVFVRAIPWVTEDNNKSPASFDLEAGELLDIGIYAPFCKSDKKDEHVFFVKNFIHSMKAEEWAFDTTETDTMFDITDDCTGEIHDSARTHIPAYINECSSRYEPTIRAEHDPEGNVHYLFGHVASKLSIPTNGEEIELFLNYGPIYENVRLRKGYSELSGEAKKKKLKELQKEDESYMEEVDCFSGESVVDCIRFFVDLFLSEKQSRYTPVSEMVRQRSVAIISRLRQRAQDILMFKEEPTMVDSINDSVARAEELLKDLK